jgi:phosphoenolpyruvate carboxykinase (ATP)
MSITHTRAILAAIHDGSLARAETRADPWFGFQVPTSCPGVPAQVLDARGTWSDGEAYDAAARKLATLFQRNFHQYEDGASDAVKQAGPRL